MNVSPSTCFMAHVAQVIPIQLAWKMESAARAIQKTFKKRQNFHMMVMVIQFMHVRIMEKLLKKKGSFMITDGWFPTMSSFSSSMIAI